MIRSMLMMAMAFALMGGQAFAGGGGKANGTLVVKNAAYDSVAIVVDPPVAWAAWAAPFTDAQKAELAKRATIITADGSQSFSVKQGAHKVLAVNMFDEAFTLTDVTIRKKQTTSITVAPGFSGAL